MLFTPVLFALDKNVCNKLCEERRNSGITCCWQLILGFFFQINCILEKSGLKFLMPRNKTNPVLDTKCSRAMFNSYFSMGLIGYLELS